MTIKISISLADETLEVLDRYIAREHVSSRSAAIQLAIARLASSNLSQEYAQAFEEWGETEEETLWNQTTGDAL